MHQYYTVRFRLALALAIFCGCLAPQISWAFVLQAADGVKAPVSLSGHLSILHDPAGALTIEDIVARHAGNQFKSIPSMLTEGYRKGATWVRFSLSASASPARWLLQIERPLIEHVTLYVPDGTGHFMVSPSGYRYPGAGDDAHAYSTIFPISVPAMENEYYIRLQSMTSITTALNVWQEEGYEKYRHFDHWIIGIFIGAVAAMILANLLYAYLLADSLYLLYAAFLLESSLIMIFHLGYADEVLGLLEPQQIRLSWGIIVCLYSMVMVWFMARLFEFRRYWIWSWRIVQTIMVLNGAALILTIAGRYGDVGLFVSWLQQFTYMYIAIFLIYLLVVRRQYQYLLSALAFSSVIVINVVMVIQYTGNNPFGINNSLGRLMAGGTLIHLILLSAAVAQRARRAEASLNDEKDRAIAEARSAELNLTIKVQERTTELAERNSALSREMDRRHLLELKLRQSLDAVNDALAQQRNFVTLVSHEFRGPLAVIAAAADNLSLSDAATADNINLRTNKIRQTVKKMSMLIENVLAGERLDAGQTPFTRHEIFDLNEVLRTAQASLDEDAASRVRFIPGDEAIVKGERNLLEIVILNLIQNALKYSSVESPVTVRLLVGQGVANADVTDQGSGVSPDDRELIFMKYYRAAGQRVSGSGLGLYISREIARQHGGTLTLATSNVIGSTFRLSLPMGGRPRGFSPS